MIRFTWRTYLGLVLFILVLFSVLALMIAERRLAPVLRTWAETRAVSLATRAINVAVEEMMAVSLSSTTMAHLVRDGEGNLQAIQYDMGEVNRVSSQATHKILQTLNNMGEEVFPIPLGQLTGLDFLASWGPGIPVRMIPLGGLTTTPVASFESAGINQTWHRVLLDIQVVMRVAVPLVSEDILVSTQVPILEEVFIGTVPTWYFTGQGNLLSSDGRLEFPLK
ncbi:MAG: sporulation protein YunB [Bacillota bacterium]|nr:sporulation protein YunB [Bacillota bacterium]NLJ02442.1 sporulation protein YunB [Bacillota bacterium]